MGGTRTLSIILGITHFAQSQNPERGVDSVDMSGIGAATRTCLILVGIKAKKEEMEIICPVQHLIMLAREFGVQMVLLSPGVKETGMLTVLT